MRKRVVAFLVMVGVCVAMFAYTAPTTTITKLYGDRNVNVYRATVTMDNSYAVGGETVSLVSVAGQILAATVESHGFNVADSVSYFFNIIDSTFSSGTLQLMAMES